GVACAQGQNCVGGQCVNQPGVFAFGDFRPARTCQEIWNGVPLDANVTIRVAIIDWQVNLNCDEIQGGVHLYADAMNTSYPFGLYHTDKRLQGMTWWAWYRHEWAGNLGKAFGYAKTVENRTGLNQGNAMDG